MKEKELLKLGFVNTSYRYENDFFTEFTFKCDNFLIQISGDSLVELNYELSGWITIPNCITIKDLKMLIKLSKT
jgi:hypothetical protein